MNQAPELRYAPFWRRVGAFGIDLIIINIFSFLSWYYVGPELLEAYADEPDFVAPGFLKLYSFFNVWLYFAIMESSIDQATIGKKIFSLKVTDLSGGRIDFGRASGRHFGKIISALLLGIGYLMPLFTKKSQSLHDILSGCLILRADSIPTLTSRIEFPKKTEPPLAKNILVSSDNIIGSEKYNSDAKKSATSSDSKALTVIIAVLCTAGVAAFVLGYFNSIKEDQPKQAIVAEKEKQYFTDPSFANAVYQIFSTPATSDIVKTGANEQTSLFTIVPFGTEKDVFVAVFLKSQELINQTGELLQCPLCEAKISAAVYQWEGGSWHLISTSKYFTEFGGWGDAILHAPVDVVYNLAPNTVGFLFENGISRTGVTHHWKQIFSLSKYGFKNLGIITLYSDNYHSCTDKSKASKYSFDEEYDEQCIKYSGVYTVNRKDKDSFAEIRVIGSETKTNEDGVKVTTPVPDRVYRLNSDHQYDDGSD